jgi:drug/metabolite transporter (DMT)-like permease
MRASTQGTLRALLAALLFGLVNVAARASTLPPIMKGAYAYLLAGLLLAVTLRGIRIKPRDWPNLLTMSLVGGALAPALLFFGLEHTTAADASILLTLEMVFTAILAAIVLGERMRRLTWVGIGLLFASALTIAYATSTHEDTTTLSSAALVGLAALGWGIDNTVSAKLVSAAEKRAAETTDGSSNAYLPHQLIAFKGLIGGSAALVVAVILGDTLALPLAEIKYVAYIGILGVGASILLFYHALQRIGATLTSSLFLPTTAIAGVLGGGLLLHERLTGAHVVSAALALAGIFLVSRQPAARRRGPGKVEDESQESPRPRAPQSRDD